MPRLPSEGGFVVAYDDGCECVVVADLARAWRGVYPARGDGEALEVRWVE
jgi:hypothetical protein